MHIVLISRKKSLIFTFYTEMEMRKKNVVFVIILQNFREINLLIFDYYSFSATQILREINLDKSRVTKSANLTISEGMRFTEVLISRNIFSMRGIFTFFNTMVNKNTVTLFFVYLFTNLFMFSFSGQCPIPRVTTCSLGNTATGQNDVF